MRIHAYSIHSICIFKHINTHLLTHTCMHKLKNQVYDLDQPTEDISEIFKHTRPAQFLSSARKGLLGPAVYDDLSKPYIFFDFKKYPRKGEDHLEEEAAPGQKSSLYGKSARYYGDDDDYQALGFDDEDRVDSHAANKAPARGTNVQRQQKRSEEEEQGRRSAARASPRDSRLDKGRKGDVDETTVGRMHDQVDHFHTSESDRNGQTQHDIGGSLRGNQDITGDEYAGEGQITEGKNRIMEERRRMEERRQIEERGRMEESVRMEEKAQIEERGHLAQGWRGQKEDAGTTDDRKAGVRDTASVRSTLTRYSDDSDVRDLGRSHTVGSFGNSGLQASGAEVKNQRNATWDYDGGAYVERGSDAQHIGRELQQTDNTRHARKHMHGIATDSGGSSQRSETRVHDVDSSDGIQDSGMRSDPNDLAHSPHSGERSHASARIMGRKADDADAAASLHGHTNQSSAGNNIDSVDEAQHGARGEGHEARGMRHIDPGGSSSMEARHRRDARNTEEQELGTQFQQGHASSGGGLSGADAPHTHGQQSDKNMRGQETQPGVHRAGSERSASSDMQQSDMHKTEETGEGVVRRKDGQGSSHGVPASERQQHVRSQDARMYSTHDDRGYIGAEESLEAAEQQQDVNTGEQQTGNGAQDDEDDTGPREGRSANYQEDMHDEDGESSEQVVEKLMRDLERFSEEQYAERQRILAKHANEPGKIKRTSISFTDEDINNSWQGAGEGRAGRRFDSDDRDDREHEHVIPEGDSRIFDRYMRSMLRNSYEFKKVVERKEEEGKPLTPKDLGLDGIDKELVAELMKVCHACVITGGVSCMWIEICMRILWQSSRRCVMLASLLVVCHVCG
jgi:hypothetical protein